MTQETGGEAWQDVRRVGFNARVALDHARATLERLLPEARWERVPVSTALGRVVAEAVTAMPSDSSAAVARIDGYAVAAAFTYGASPYNPIEPPGSLVEVVAGQRMPPGTDAVLAYAAADATTTRIEIVEPVAPGDGIIPADAGWGSAAAVVPAGRRLDALDLARAAAVGIEEITVRRQPRIALLVAGPKQPRSVLDPVTVMLEGLIARDGGQVTPAGSVTAVGGSDLALVAGRSGCGIDDTAAPAIAAAGRMLLHGLAIAPGGSAGLGIVDGVTVVLVPGDPLACLTAYELLAGPAIRRLAGLDPALPQPRVRRCLAAKIASRVGTTELWLVGAAGQRVVPLAHPDMATLATTAGAVGFVLVPAACEGHPAGAEVEVHRLGERHG